MTTRNDTGSRANLLPVLAAHTVLCLGGAAVLTLLTHNTPPMAATAELPLVLQRVPYEAQNALRGESSAFDALAKSVARLKTLRGAVPERSAGATGTAAWNKLTDAVTAVGEARASVEA